MRLASGLIVASVIVLLLTAAGPQTEDRKPMPEFNAPGPSSWINSPPLTVEELRGNVLLVEVWTFG